MEENKTKVITMEGRNINSDQSSKSNSSEGRKKLTYEQLNDACNQLWQHNKQLAMRNRELEQYAMNKRMDYLFKVLEYREKFSNTFILDCVNEIEEAMTIPHQKDEKSK